MHVCPFLISASVVHELVSFSSTASNQGRSVNVTLKSVTVFIVAIKVKYVVHILPPFLRISSSAAQVPTSAPAAVSQCPPSPSPAHHGPGVIHHVQCEYRNVN